WESNYGALTLTQSGARVTGTYYDGDGTLAGTLTGSTLRYQYRDSTDSGCGEFVFAADGNSFTGTWQGAGSGTWNGQRPGQTAAAGNDNTRTFTGTFTTTFGTMVLTQTGSSVTGTYDFAGGSSITGTVSGQTLTFTYREPSVSGEGEFVLAADGNSFTGKWREQDGDTWNEWTGTRAGTGSTTTGGGPWLVILEAPWEESLAESPYSFGEMLTAYFRRLPDVRVRVRVINDRTDFQRAARQLAFLNGPVYLLLSGHGDRDGFYAGNDHVTATEISAAINQLPNLKLLNFSACSMMAGQVPQQVLNALPAGRHLTISGYTTDTDWGSSACLEFFYYSLIFDQELAPAAAARLVQRELNFAGERQTSGSPVEPLGFTFVEK
ncbi:MAG TPA: hypothetical protein PKM88_14690, partial [bacterium]|nr:hypothetical protein [bacterium]